ncbi:zinc finger protein 646 isoform X4 [Microtus ochrogaster]|nr:zinc finger protein 646 isoform X4 [Microtus ochrogaster]XP_026636864.1 zinc finger protein 646 isoform X4 [Microtus ochrogaster]XP_026636865.1 zinc finger protein 646 isoform X4 [Microtus ochrogaster]XP_026636866.1 zinc finger protein 646 isoform X4 [Microtus ochrogaster]
MEDMPLSISCSDCQRHFPSLPELSRHRELLHPSTNQHSEEADSVLSQRNHESGLFPCTTCGQDFTNPMSHQSHMRTHAPEGLQRHRPLHSKETTSHRQSETMAAEAWGQRLGSREAWGNQTKHVREAHECDAGVDPRTAPGTWEDPPTKQREGLEMQPGLRGSAEDWVPTTTSDGVPPLPTPASSLLSNLEQYLAESVVNFTGSQESTEPLPAEEERRYKCNQCGKTYKHAGSLTNHRQSHTLGVYPCAICFKEFSNLMALKNHSRLHAQYRPYHCPHCPRAFRLPRDLLEHQQSHEGEKLDQPWEEREMPTTNGHADERSWNQLPKAQMLNGSGELEDGSQEEYRPFCCRDCGRTYRHAGSLINHRKSHQTGIYPCSVCSKQLFNAAALKNHVRAHHRPRQGAGEDGQSSVSSTALMSAETTQKEEEVLTTNLDHRPYKCNECGRAYRHRGSLVNHRHSHRTGEYQCSLCPRKYPNLMALRNHVRVHCKATRRSTDPGTEGSPSPVKREQPDPMGTEAAFPTDQGPVYRQEEATSIPPTADKTTPQICNICGMFFEDLKSLERHGRTHRAGEGEKSRTDNTRSPPRTFACRDCGKSYRHSGSLINHRQTHQTGDFSCGTCAKHFHTMAAMKSHLRRHSRQWNRRRQKQDSTGEESKRPPAGTWTQKLENDEGLESSQDPLGESPCGTEGHLKRGGDCLQAGSQDSEYGLGRDESRFPGGKEDTGTEEGLEKKEACFLGHMDIPGDEESSEVGFCDSLPGVDSDQKPGICQSNSSPPADSDTVWKAEVTHTCSDCGDSFPQAADLLSHKSCHPPGIYQCSLCPKEFDSLPALRSHFQNHRPGEVASAQPFLCCLCGMIFPGRTGYRRHLRQVHGASGIPEGSEEDEEGTAESASTHSPPLQLSEAELLNQLQREVEALDGAGYGHICGCCGQTYDDLGSLERHHQSQSSSNMTENIPSHLEGSGDAVEMATDDVFEGTVTSVSEEGGDTQSEEGAGGTVADSLCMQAGESFPKSHPRPFQCNQCGKTYRHGGSLVNHRKIHQTGNFICPVCSRCYPNLAAYRNHLRNHPRCKGSEPQVGPIAEAGGSNEPQNVAEAGGSNEPQNVAEAGQEQAVVGQLHEELKVEPLEELAGVKEEVWEETTVKEEELEQRLETAEKGCQTEVSSERPFSCEVCGRTYKHAGSLINHRQSHQTGHFGCQACSKGFSNLMSLKNHRRIHADPRRFRCSDCGKAFRLRKQLANHQRVHTERRRGRGTQKLTREDRSFRCGQCGRNYRHAGSLLNHQCTQETGQYSCSFCFKTYSNRTALKDHQRLHSDSRRRRTPRRGATVRCTLCGCGFPGQRSLERHLQEHEETKLDLTSGQGDPHDAEGSKENLADDWGVEGRPEGTQSVPQLELGTKRPGEHSQSPSRPAQSEVTESLSWEVGKVDGYRGERGQMTHNGAWVPQDQLAKPEGKLEDTGSKNSCHLSESQSSDSTVSYMDSQDGGDSSSRLQSESHPSCSQCGKTYQPDGLLNPSIDKKVCHSCLLCSPEILSPVTTKIHNHIAAQTFACRNCSKVFASHSELATHMQTHAVDNSQVPGQTEETREPQAWMAVVDPPGPGNAQEASSEPRRDPEENGEPANGGQGTNLTAAEDKERPFCCAQCGRSYRHAGSLLNHQKAHTTGLYPCSLCPKLLPNLLSLKNHSRTHTDPKRYSCNICGKAFRTAARLRGHGRVHAPQEGPFTCSHCPRHFRHRNSFLQHQQQHQEEWTMSSSGASMVPASSRGDGDSSTASLLNPSPPWPADLNFSL